MQSAGLSGCRRFSLSGCDENGPRIKGNTAGERDQHLRDQRRSAEDFKVAAGPWPLCEEGRASCSGAGTNHT